MADDLLVAKLFNYICGSGGFVELSVLLKPFSPLGSRKTKREAKDWLKVQGPQAGFVCVTDQNDEIVGVRIDLRKKICYEYVVKGSCRRAQGKCKYWHICKSYIEGVCEGKCHLSHDFHSEDNQQKAKELSLEKLANGTIRNIVAWSLPQVCQLYLRNECKSDKCPYLHVCSQDVQGLSCKCRLSHDITDSHNIKILKQYDLVPPCQVINKDFVRCSILVLIDQKCIETRKFPVDCNAAAVTQETPSVIVSRKQNASSSGNKQVTAVSAKPADKQKSSATLSSVANPAKKQENNILNAKVLFECLCKEFNCSAPLTVLKSRNYVNEVQDASLLLQENNDKFLFTRNENDNIRDITAFCPKLRLCFDFVSFSECKNEDCTYFHLCRKFITGSCSRGNRCSRPHTFRNKRDQETVLKLDLDWLTNEQLRQLMLSSSPQVCTNYNKGKCTNHLRCSRVHICKDFVVNACKNGDACRFQHKGALDTHHTRSLLEKYGLGKINHEKALKTILVCEEDRGPCRGLATENAKRDDLTEGSVVNSVPEQTRVSGSIPSSHHQSMGQKRRKSVSSSYSSLSASDKVTTSKKAVFACIIREYDGSVPCAIISKRRDLFPEDFENIVAWFRSRKDSFRLIERADGTILEVCTFCPRAGFCFNYTSSASCSRKDCQYFHVCREYAVGVCNFGSRCKWNHNFQFDHDRKFISKLELDELTDEELCKVLQLSMPQVCLHYNEGECQHGGSCSLVHVCKDFIKKKCQDSANCGLEHEEALRTSHTRTILQNYGLKCTDGNLNFVLNTLLVCGKSNVSTPTTSTSNIRTPTVQESPKQPSQGRTKPSDVMSKTSLSSSASWTPCFPTEQKVFECLCKEYGSSISFNVIAERKDLFPHGSKSAEGWFRKTKGSFLMTENNHGVITQVDAFSGSARVCWSYNNNGECAKHDCTYLHICRDYIIDSCSGGVTCPLNHHFNNQRDRAWLSRINLDQFTDLQLQRLVLSSAPQICVEYNNGECSRGDSCTKIHMCCGYLRKCCSGEYECGLDHETAMDTDQTKAVLQRFMLTSVYKPDVLQMILDDKRSLSGKDKTKCHIHKDKPDAFICSEFLIGGCRKGSRCLKHHCFMPYHWQYRGSISDQWISFSEKDNLAIEKLYCDVNVETPVNFKSAQSLDLSRLGKDGRLPCDLKYEVMIDQDNMTITFQRPRGGGSFSVGLLRRLSTVSCFTNPCDLVFTNWKWYWKDNDNVWHMYDKDYAGRDLQRLIEQAFQDTLDQGKTRAIFKFTTKQHVYNLFLNWKGEMYQVNLKTGTKRQVKRRPEKPISDEDMDDLKWVHGDSSMKRNIEKRAAKSNVPSQWSSMPPSAQYTRVRLLPSSAEFNDVVQLFRKSMNDYVVVESIDRVQNPFMWEKYCRKKENMMAIARRNQRQVDEKRLFHGTSPGTVEAICKQNFDWRLHGKNATVYGEGSYFAVNASYSHAYAKRDADLSQFMFLARVLVGSYTEGHSSYRRPPPKQPSNPASDLYDSCVNDKSNPTIFVVFDTDQFYPEYVIKYASQTTSDHYSSLRQPKPATLSQPPRSQTHLRRSPSGYDLHAAPSTSKTSVRSGYSQTQLRRSSSSYDLHAAPSTSKTSVRSGYSQTQLRRSSSSHDLHAAPSTSKTSVRSGYSQTQLRRSSSSYDLHAAPSTSKTSVRSGYSTTTSSTGLTAGNAPRSIKSPRTASKPSGSAASTGYSKVPQTHSTSYSSSQPTTPLPKPRNSQTHPRGILKHPPSSSNNPVSTPSVSAAQRKSSTSAVSNSGFVSANPRRGTTLNPSGSATQSGYSTMSQTTSANGSSPRPRTTTLARPPNSQTYSNEILKRQPSPRSFPAQTGYTASTASSSGLTSAKPIRASNNLGTASSPSGSLAGRGCSSSLRPSSAPTLPYTSGLYTRDVASTSSHLSMSSRGFQTATNSNVRRTKKEDCVLL